MTDREREIVLVIRKALRKKRAYGITPVMRNGMLEVLYPSAWRVIKKIADRRLGIRTQVFVGRNQQGWWVTMSPSLLDSDDEKYIATINNIIKSNIAQGYEEPYDTGD